MGMLYLYVTSSQLHFGKSYLVLFNFKSIFVYVVTVQCRVFNVFHLYYNSEVCVCVCLCTFYLKTVNGNDLVLFVS